MIFKRKYGIIKVSIPNKEGKNMSAILTVMLVVLIGYAVIKVLTAKGEGVVDFLLPWRSWKWYGLLILNLILVSIFG